MRPQQAGMAVVQKELSHLCPSRGVHDASCPHKRIEAEDHNGPWGDVVWQKGSREVWGDVVGMGLGSGLGSA